MAEPDTTAAVEVEYFAWAADTVGTERETLQVAGGKLAGVRAAIVNAHGAVELLEACRFFVDEVLTRDLSRPHGRKVDVLPPFTGG